MINKEKMNSLKQIIDRNYSTLPKLQVANITVDVCTQQINGIKQKLEQGNFNKEEEISILRKIKLYEIISEGVLELAKNNRDQDKIDFAKLHISLLLEMLENENLEKLENSNPTIQEKIINNVFVPNYLIEWSLNNL